MGWHNRKMGIGVGEISAETQAVIDRMTGLSGSETSAIATFVDAEVTNGNWDLIDEFWCFGLDAEANALTGWINKTATNNGALKVTAGFDFGSGNHIDSNWNPQSDAVNYAVNDAMFGGYGEITDTSTNNEMIGMRISSRNANMRISSTFDQIVYAVHTTNANSETFSYSPKTEFLGTFAKTASNLTTFYEDGVSKDTSTKAGQSLFPNGTFYIGRRNLDGSPVSVWSGTISSIILSAAIGFDQSGHYDNLITLLTNLGAI